MNYEKWYNPDGPQMIVRKPHNMGDKTIYTNSYTLLVVPKAGEHDDVPEKNRGYLKTLLREIEIAKYKPLPEYEMPEKIDCWQCEEERTDDCDYCEGEGFYYNAEAYVDIFGVHVNPEYFELIMDMENIEVSASRNKESLYFRSGEKSGIIKGIRYEEAE